MHPIARLRELSAAREILANIIRKEIKVKYKSSVLGVAWSMLNPVLYLAVFSLVFAVVLKNDVPHFPVYLLSGLLAWNLFSTSLTLAARFQDGAFEPWPWTYADYREPTYRAFLKEAREYFRRQLERERQAL